jgi:hypothetical protein
MTKIAGSGSESIGQRHGSADPDPDLDPHQNVMDPQHWYGDLLPHRWNTAKKPPPPFLPPGIPRLRIEPRPTLRQATY